MYVKDGSGAIPSAAPPRTYKTPTKAYGVTAPPKSAAPKSAPRPVSKPTYHAPAQTYSAPAAPSRPAARYSAPTIAPSSGKTIGSNNQGRITPIAPKKPAPVVAAKPAIKAPAKPAPLWDATQDVTYQQQEADARNALADYLAGQGNAQNQYNIENVRNDENLGHNKQLAYDSLHDDFSSRGLATSGMALKAYQDQSDEYARQQSVLDQGALNFGTTALSQLGNFKSTQAINDEKYKNDAINRHASGLKLI